MEFRVLGPLEVLEGGQRLAIAAGRERALLALLLIHANQVVAVDRILDEIWGETIPESGAKTVAFHVSRLRDALCPDRRKGEPCEVLRTENGGYALHVEPEAVDAGRFEHLAAEGRAALATDPGTARARLVEALSLWRGEPFADLTYESFAQPEIGRLGELRLRTLEDRLEADLALGRHGDVVGELEGLLAAHPLRERLRGQLMTALYRAGRQAEALRVYDHGRRLLAEELGIEPSDELERLQTWILQQDPRLAGAAAGRRPRNPYKGLRAFDEGDRADFYGREGLVSRLLDRLAQVTRARRLLAVVGPSGSGKSSVVRAGLVPALRAGSLPGSDAWRVEVMFPGARPFRELAAAVERATGRRSAGLEARLERDGDLADVIAADLPSDVPWLALVIDQFEELFALVDGSRQERFLTVLADALAAPDGRLLVITTLRADAFDRPLRSPRFGELVRIGTEVVTPMEVDELERAIVRPARSVGMELEPGLASEIIADVARQAGELPLLQYALTELFERGDGRRMTREGYRAIGGVVGALSRRAEETYLALDGEDREIARQVFLRLVDPGDGGGAGSRRATRIELEALAGDGQRVADVIDRFGRGRLVSFDRDPVTGEALVTVAHEALLSSWPRLAGWVDEARDDIRMHRRLADAAADWEEADRDPGFLLTGSRLDAMIAWGETTSLRLDASERALLDASTAQQRREHEAEARRAERERALERRARMRLRVLAVALAALVVVTTSMAVAVYGQGESAREQGDIALARELATASVASLANDPDLSLLLAVRAADATADRGYIVEEAMDALHWALQEAHVTYPADGAGFAVDSGPGGVRGVELLPPATLMSMAEEAAGRSLSDAECRTYLHVAACPSEPVAPTQSLAIYTTSGVVPAERLASGSLAGTSVALVSALPADLDPALAAFRERTGITVDVTRGGTDDLMAEIDAGSVPDIAIVSRPETVVELARDGLLVDLGHIVDVATYRGVAGDLLTSLGTVGADGTWPADEGRLVGATFAAEVASLIWYPAVAFERAGYEVPASWGALLTLTAKMAADGGTPWCLGDDTGAALADLVDDLILHEAGLETYDDWVDASMYIWGPTVREALKAFDAMAGRDELVLGGLRSIPYIPQDLGALPMIALDPPQCWLYPGSAEDGASLQPAGSSTRPMLAAFAFPASEPASSETIRGHVSTVVVFSDRPEVRELTRELLSPEFAAAAAPAFASAGISTLAAADAADQGIVQTVEQVLLRQSLEDGTFRVAAADRMDPADGAAFAALVLGHVEQLIRESETAGVGP